jgi:hypothetical protein
MNELLNSSLLIKCFVRLALGAACSGVIYLLGIMPIADESRGLKASIEETRQKFSQKQAILPLFQEICMDLQKQKAVPPSRDYLFGINTTIELMPVLLQEMAVEGGIDDFGFSPIPESVADDGERLSVEGTMSCAFDKFRGFLIRLIMAEGFERLESLEVGASEGSMEFRFRFWLNKQAVHTPKTIQACSGHFTRQGHLP